jgi:hypothetical protein
MAQFPVTDQQGIIDGLNYALSGPVSSGANFVGISAWLPSSVTGNFRIPFSSPDTGGIGNPSAFITVDLVALSTAEMLDGRTFKFTFAAPAATPPFVNGQPLQVTGVVDPWYNDTYQKIGVVECTTTYVITRADDTYPIEAPSTGGYALVDNMNTLLSTELNGKVTVTGGTDRVLVSTQITNSIYMQPLTAGTFYYTVQLNRYYSLPADNAGNATVRWNFDQTIMEKVYTLDTATLTPGQPFPEVETIFASVIDSPPIGYYWYILEIEFDTLAGAAEVAAAQLTQRSFTAQVVKA